MSSRRLTRRALLSAAPAAAAAGLGLSAPRYPDGLLLVDEEGPQEIGAYAVLHTSGRLAMAAGSLDDIFAAPRIPMIVCNMGLWEVGAVWVTSGAIFHDANAERRELPYVVNRASMRTTRLRIVALEDSANIRRLAEVVGAGPGRPLYAVFTANGGAATRHYLVRLTSAETP